MLINPESKIALHMLFMISTKLHDWQNNIDITSETFGVDIKYHKYAEIKVIL